MTVDISSSMLAQDLKPDRLEAAKNVGAEFIAGRPEDRIGLVVFASETFSCPGALSFHMPKKAATIRTTSIIFLSIAFIAALLSDLCPAYA